MKMLVLALTMVLSFNLSAKTPASGSDIKKYSELNRSQQIAQGYTSAEVKVALKAPLLKWLESMTAKKLVTWTDFVINGEEYDHLSAEAKREVAKNPLKTLQVEAILEVTEIVEVKKDGKVVGYVVEVADHVQGAIYQDGAWYVLFLDPNMKVIVKEEHSA